MKMSAKLAIGLGVLVVGGAVAVATVSPEGVSGFFGKSAHEREIETLIANKIDAVNQQGAVGAEGVNITYSALDYSEKSNTMALNDVTVAIKGHPEMGDFDLSVDEFESTYLADVAGGDGTVKIPENMTFSIKDMRIPVSAVMSSLDVQLSQGLIGEAEVALSKEVIGRLAENDALTASLSINSERVKERSMKVEYASEVKNLMSSSLDFTVDNLYSLDGQSYNDQNLPMTMATTLGLSDVKFSVETQDFVSLFGLVLSKQGMTVEQVESQLESELERAQGQLDSQPNSLLYKVNIDAIKGVKKALDENKEMVFTVSFTNVNMMTVMGIMGLSTVEQQSQYLMDTFQFDYRIDVK